MVSQKLGRLLPLVLSSVMVAAPVMAQDSSGMTHSVVLEDLENPWDMAFLGDGTMFYTEKCK
ncbi:MAG: PQQ-dependent sugar dehydrogenase, partial [Pseudomonadota bacterium]